MEDYFTQFSCIFDVCTAGNATRAMSALPEVETAIEKDSGNAVGFSIAHTSDPTPGALWIHSDDFGEPEHVIQFVLHCATAMNLTGLWGFVWTHTCSKPSLDAFGGGATVIDLGKRERVHWIGLGNWLEDRIAESTGSDGTAGDPPSPVTLITQHPPLSESNSENETGAPKP